jgi:hypothetical protein
MRQHLEVEGEARTGDDESLRGRLVHLVRQRAAEGDAWRLKPYSSATILQGFLSNGDLAQSCRCTDIGLIESNLSIDDCNAPLA